MRQEEGSRAALAKRIDHAILRPELTRNDLCAQCDRCAEFGVWSVCVRPSDVSLAVKRLDGTGVHIGTVVAFPHGTAQTSVKAGETARAVDDGAEEIDMVLNIARLRSGEVEYVRDDIAAVVSTAAGRCVKVILETCYLEEAPKIAACRSAVQAGAQFVKTSTGFAPAGATVEDVRLLRREVGPDFGVKASGGIRTLADAKAMLAAGANRLGTSRTAEILAKLPAG